MYRQVRLKKGNAVQVCWIEEEYANKGWRLELSEDKGEVWTVVEVFTGKMNSDGLNSQRKAQKTFESKLK